MRVFPQVATEVGGTHDLMASILLVLYKCMQNEKQARGVGNSFLRRGPTPFCGLPSSDVSLSLLSSLFDHILLLKFEAETGCLEFGEGGMLERMN